MKELLSLPAYSSFTKLQITAKPSLRGVHGMMCFENSLCGSDELRFLLLSSNTSSCDKLFFLKSGEKFTEKLLSSTFSSSSIPMLTCACTVSDGQQMGWSQAPSVYFCDHQCLSTLANNYRNHIHHRC